MEAGSQKSRVENPRFTISHLCGGSLLLESLQPLEFPLCQLLVNLSLVKMLDPLSLISHLSNLATSSYILQVCGGLKRQW